MKNGHFTPFDRVQLKDGFWQKRYALNREVSIDSVQARFEETARFDALRFNYLKTAKKPHIFFDSDAAKWIQAVAYLLKVDRKGLEEKEAFIDELVDCMERAQREDGYLNSYFQQIEPNHIYKRRNDHELYCSGHLIEAAIAYHEATGKRKFLDVMEKCCDCIERAFFIEKTAAFQTPGHEEIELALFKLWQYTGKEKYRKMAEEFLARRAQNTGGLPENWWYNTQDDQSVFALEAATGHSVRALYLYSAIADWALASGDERLKKSLDNVWTDMQDRKLYITGGVGSTHAFEGFTVPYDLQNDTAYSESCCAIAYCLFAMRMRKIERDAKYGALIEREFYNNLLSSCSLDGKAFFYTNPLEISLEDRFAMKGTHGDWYPITTRLEVFGCSCCPPNINRFFAFFPEAICFEESTGAVIEQYISSLVRSSLGDIEIEEEYATKGTVKISSKNYAAKEIVLRNPEWCKSVSVRLNGQKITPKTENGYTVVEVNGTFELAIDFHIAPVFIAANPRVRADAGRVALSYGPVVYCLEGVDNGGRLNELSVELSAAKEATVYPDFHGLYSVELKGYREKQTEKLYFDASEREQTEQTLKFVPYFAFANRGESDMLVWVRRK